MACSLRSSEADLSATRVSLEKEHIDWDDLFSRASFHRIEPQVLSIVEKIGSPVPQSVIAKFREAVEANLVRQLRYVSEFFIINESLAREGVIAIPFKGFWLGDSAYGDIAERVSSDIDLFIDLDDLDTIRKIMTGKGYLGHEGMDRLTDEYIRKEMAEYNFGRDQDGTRMVHIEFHWRSAMAFYNMNITLDDLKPQICNGTLQGREVTVFSPTANLLLAVMHHGGKDCYWQLRQVLDIAHIIRKYPDLDAGWLFKQAERFHVTTLLLLGMRLANDLTGVEVPEPFAGYLSDKRLARMAKGRMKLMALPHSHLAKYKDRLASWRFKVASRDGIGIKISLSAYTLRKVIVPRIVPERWRHHFFNRKIRRSTIVSQTY